MLPILPILASAALAVTAVVVSDKSDSKRRKRIGATGSSRALALVPEPNRSVRRRGRAAANLANTARRPENGRTDPLIGGSDPQAEERHINSALTLGASGLGVAVAGTMLASPLAYLSIPLLIYPLGSYFVEGYRALVVERRLNMAALEGLMIGGFVVTGQLVALGLLGTMLAVAKKLLMKAEDRSQRRVIDIFRGHARTVWVRIEGQEIEIPFETLAKGDTLVTRAGEFIAADGIVLDGSGAVDQSMLTGESRPVEKTAGDPVSAATMVLSGALVIRVERSGDETTAGQIAAILNKTLDYRQNLQWRWLGFIDKLVLPSTAAAAVTLPFLGPAAAVAMLFAVSGLGYSMLMVAPIQLLRFLREASVDAILVKDGRVLEQLSQVDTVVFDKTGTLTEDRPHVGAIHALDGCDEDTLLAYAAAVEQRQSHPIAAAILDAAQAGGIRPEPIAEAELELGFGLRAMVGGRDVHVGSRRFMDMLQIPLPLAADAISEASHEAGHSLVWVAADRQILGALELFPTIRDEAAEVIAQLKARGLSVFILSGDHEQPTRHLARHLSVDDYFAEVLPTGKSDVIERLQAQGRRVCFVGDGVNDTLALRRADVSVSLSGASTVAKDTAQVVMMDQTLKRLPGLFALADRFKDNMDLSFKLTGAPVLASAGGVWLLHLGLVPVIGLYYVGLGLGVTQAGLPLLTSPSPADPTPPAREAPGTGTGTPVAGS